MKELEKTWGAKFQAGPWFWFRDENGPGYAQPDGLIEFPTRVLLVEVKLTGWPHGKVQMEDLYQPLLEKFFGKPVVRLLICKGLTPSTPGPFFSSLEEFLASGQPYGCWHWIGAT